MRCASWWCTPGGGVPLFTPDAYPGHLRLVGTISWASGILELEYRPGLA